MKRDETLREIDARIDAGAGLSPELEARLRSQPHLRRKAQALARVDELLRAELGRADGWPAPALGARVLARLPARPRRRRVLPWAALAASALLAVGLGLRDARREAASAALPSLLDPASLGAGVPLARWLDWRAPLAPERVLLEEAELLASDTRRTAASLWSRLPLTSLLARDGR